MEHELIIIQEQYSQKHICKTKDYNILDKLGGSMFSGIDLKVTLTRSWLGLKMYNVLKLHLISIYFW